MDDLTMLALGGDLAQSLAGAPDTFFETVREIAGNILRFFTEASYGRMAMLGAFILGGLWIYFRYRGRR